MATQSPRRTAGFRLLGFPVTIGRGFIFVLLFLSTSGFSSGGGGFNWRRFLFSVAAYTGFMLVHELGHAVAARRFGSKDVAISLDFLIGYASFRPPADITKKRLAIISAAGPVTEIVSGLIVLLAMGANLASWDSMRTGSYRFTVLWFGPILGLANLIPILPLDGGNIVSLGFEKLNPKEGRRYFQMVSLGLSICIALYGLANSQGLGGLSVFVLPGIMLTLMNFAALQQMNAARSLSTTPAAALAGEDRAWQTGDLSTYPAGVTPSPWILAASAAAKNDEGDARRIILDSLTRPTGYWQLSDNAQHDVLLYLVDLVDEPVPVDNLHGARTYHHVLHRLGYLQRASQYGARVYALHNDAFTAHQIATELALLGHHDHAMAWLRTALADPEERTRLSDSGLDSLRQRPDFALALEPLPPPR
jgi:Zn-dependent protease